MTGKSIRRPTTLWWLARLHASFALYDVIRVDHFRGFDQYCKIPAHATNAREYEWVPGPGLDLFESIKAEFPEARLVAEDLGIITDSVRELVEAIGVPGHEGAAIRVRGSDRVSAS